MTRNNQQDRPAFEIKRVVYVIAGLYLAMGLLLAVCATFASAPIGVCLGLLIIGAAIAAVAGFNCIFRLDIDLAAVREGFDEIRAGLRALERADLRNDPRDRSVGRDDSPQEDDTVVVDLAAFGPGDPTPITAATLDRSTFPRLVRALDDLPPTEIGTPAAPATKALCTTAGILIAFAWGLQRKARPAQNEAK